MNTKPVLAIATLAVLAFAGNTAMAQQSSANRVTESPDEFPAQYAQYLHGSRGNALTRAQVQAPVLAAHAAGVTQFAAESPDALPGLAARTLQPSTLSRADVKAPVLAAHAAGVTQFATESADEVPAGRAATVRRSSRTAARS